MLQLPLKVLTDRTDNHRAFRPNFESLLKMLFFLSESLFSFEQELHCRVPMCYFVSFHCQIASSAGVKYPTIVRHCFAVTLLSFQLASSASLSVSRLRFMMGRIFFTGSFPCLIRPVFERSCFFTFREPEHCYSIVTTTWSSIWGTLTV